MKIAITGATGFVGSRLVERLQEEGHTVVVFTRSADLGQKLFPANRFPQVSIVEYTPLESGDWQGAVGLRWGGEPGRSAHLRTLER